MPGRRMIRTPRKPSTIEPARLSVKRSPRMSTARSPAHTGIMNSIANTVASGSTMTALAQPRFARKGVRWRHQDGDQKHRPADAAHHQQLEQIEHAAELAHRYRHQREREQRAGHPDD